jgi:16S rRNA (adenine1518-N6/adenine1519-N6)-dimethyltransferase
MSQERDAFSVYRQRLDALGFRPSSARGQNFLLDPTLHAFIAERAEIGPADHVLEVGVGLGFLTKELAARAGFVVGVEIDTRLFAVASQDLAACANVELVLADALSGEGGSLPAVVQERLASRQPCGGNLLVVGNLPYAASGPLLAELACLERLPQRIVILVQKELGDRLAAPAGGSDFGGLSALLQSLYRIERLRRVGSEVFRPRPKVDSAIVRLDLLPQAAGRSAVQRRSLQRFLRALFGQRRKTLRTTVRQAAAALQKQVPELPTSLLELRAEALSAADLLALHAAVDGAPPS